MAQNWYKLDNVAKIMPPSIEGADTRVFRVVCELKENVDPDLLQAALEKTLPEFPFMTCCLRRGLFWYYLDNCQEQPQVAEEKEHALASLYLHGQRSLLFRVRTFGKRINVEVFHALTDGTGGFSFLVHLLTHYLSDRHGLDYARLAQDVSSITQKEEDAFRQFYAGRRDRKLRQIKSVRRNFLKEMFPKRAYQIRGEVDEDFHQHLLEGTVSTKKLVGAAHHFGVTVGVLVVALYVEAMLAQMSVREMRHPIVVSVPVNLRQFFPSETTRNFFGAIQVAYDSALYDGTLESVLPTIAEEFQKNLTEEQLYKTMNSYAALEHNYAIKMAPLFLKYPVIRNYNRMMKRGVTTSVSNVGKVELPKEMQTYVEKFCGFMTGRTVFLCVVTYGDKTVFGISSCFQKHDVAMHFFRRLTALQIPVELATNDYNGEEV